MRLRLREGVCPNHREMIPRLQTAPQLWMMMTMMMMMMMMMMMRWPRAGHHRHALGLRKTCLTSDQLLYITAAVARVVEAAHAHCSVLDLSYFGIGTYFLQTKFSPTIKST